MGRRGTDAYLLFYHFDMVTQLHLHSIAVISQEKRIPIQNKSVSGVMALELKDKNKNLFHDRLLDVLNLRAQCKGEVYDAWKQCCGNGSIHICFTRISIT